MRIVALAALFAVVSGETLKHGYGLGNGDLQFDLISGTKTSTRAYSLTLPSWATFNSQSGVSSANWWLSIRLYVSAVDCPQCAAQTIDLHSRIGATAATAADPKILDKAGGTALGTSGIWADIPLPALTSGDQTVQFFINITCTACRNSAELSRLEAIVRNVDKSLPAASQMVVFGSFDRDNDRNTDQFSGSVGSWGPVVRIPAITATDYVIVVQEIAALSSGSGIVYYFSTNQTGFATGISTYDAATLACASATTGSGCASVTFFTTPPAGSQFWRAPSSSYTTGEFPAAPSNLGSLSAGTWYVAPFITKKGAGTSSPAYRFAIGFNAVPAAAAGLVPSFVVVALATVFAALRV